MNKNKTIRLGYYVANTTHLKICELAGYKNLNVGDIFYEYEEEEKEKE